MTFTYAHPLVIKIGPEELKIVKVTHGTTTVELSDGRVIRLSIDVQSVIPNADDPDFLDINHSISVQIIAKPEFPVSENHETVQ